MDKVKEILFKKSDKFHIQFLRYAPVAIIALAVDVFGLFASKHWLGLNTVVATSIGFCLGLVVNYILSVFWVFTASNRTKRWHELVIFSAIGLAGLVMTDLIVWLLNKHIGLAGAKAVAVFIVFFWNFLARKKILYSGPLVETTL